MCACAISMSQKVTPSLCQLSWRRVRVTSVARWKIERGSRHSRSKSIGRYTQISPIDLPNRSGFIDTSFTVSFFLHTSYNIPPCALYKNAVVHLKPIKECHKEIEKKGTKNKVTFLLSIFQFVVLLVCLCFYFPSLGFYVGALCTASLRLSRRE